MSTAAVQILKIQEEYNSTFKDVLQSYADAGEGLVATANEIGMRSATLTTLLEHMGWRDMFKPMSKFNKLYLCQGHTSTIKEHAARMGVSYSTARVRVLEEAENAARKTHFKKYIFNGVCATMREHCEREGLTPYQFKSRYHRQECDGVVRSGGRSSGFRSR